MGKVAFASFIGTATEFYDFCRCSGSYIPVIRLSSPCPSRWAWSSSRLYGPMGAFLPELYGTRLRYSGAAVSYNLGWVFGGAFAPLIAGQLLASIGGSWSISLYVLAMAAVSFACIWLLSETHLTDLTESGPRSAGSSPRPANRRPARGSARTADLGSYPSRITATGLTGEPVAPTSFKGVQTNSKR
jgi:MFS family permease